MLVDDDGVDTCSEGIYHQYETEGEEEAERIALAELE